MSESCNHNAVNHNEVNSQCKCNNLQHIAIKLYLCCFVAICCNLLQHCCNIVAICCNLLQFVAMSYRTRADQGPLEHCAPPHPMGYRGHAYIKLGECVQQPRGRTGSSRTTSSNSSSVGAPPARNSKRPKMPPKWAPRSDFSIFGVLHGLGEKEI